MSAFSGKEFLMGIEHLDAKNRSIYENHGNSQDGRWSIVEQIVDDVMLRLAGLDDTDASHGKDRHH
ncbi:hypothetical protein KAI87_08690 [Myxococcota bacterium]|nr:hypothetical protein [Myxococcota bacterium]